MKCKKIKAGYGSIWCALLLLICPMGAVAVGDTPPSIEIQNVAYSESDDDVIPVVLAADNNYGPQMYITMLSILKNSNADTRYDFYLLVPSDFKIRYKNPILELGASYGAKINFVDVGTAFADVPLKNDWPAPSYYRLLIPSSLPNYKKCLYLDTDIIVRHDLGKLLNTDLEDCYIAGVKEDHRWVKEVTPLLALDVHESDHYVNSGVLVMNLDLMRRDNLQAKLVSMAKHGFDGERTFLSLDQDILNVVCRDRIKLLDLKFNVFSRIPEAMLNSECERVKIQKFYGEKHLHDACNDPVIIHFTGEKPWQSPTKMLDNKWWEICRLSPFYEEILCKYIESRVMAVIDARMAVVDVRCRAFRYNKYTYYRCKILSKLTFGKKRTHYQHKCEEIKKALGIH
ncbi:MAG: glycosyltransferase family 8 protein [Puniceicoccales bacterium]|jgi:lipopolysaccharide biosynthesis glycosyltransferase|nr:glycosyltransferase family 8 protein [Puniceicoccales bacterium]